MFNLLPKDKFSKVIITLNVRLQKSSLIFQPQQIIGNQNVKFFKYHKAIRERIKVPLETFDTFMASINGRSEECP